MFLRKLGLGLAAAAPVVGLLVTGGSASAAPVDTAPATAKAAPCKSGSLAIRLGRSEAAAGTMYQGIKFINKSNKACWLKGFPRAVYVNKAHKRIGLPAGRDAPISEFKPVRLAPTGGYAVSTLRVPSYGAFPVKKCKARKAAALRVRAPHSATGARKFTRLPFKQRVCTTKAGRSLIDPITHR